MINNCYFLLRKIILYIWRNVLSFSLKITCTINNHKKRTKKSSNINLFVFDFRGNGWWSCYYSQAKTWRFDTSCWTLCGFTPSKWRILRRGNFIFTKMKTFLKKLSLEMPAKSNKAFKTNHIWDLKWYIMDQNPLWNGL